ncbi:MAG: glycogen debranching enzyme N-terminal domain-containing protein [Phycisphaerae bacterium]|nr:glycogen debranching enzyme N-terminal domain-containing protein [Phycisphaerae bacterium]
MVIEREQCNQLDSVRGLEWLVTSGAGGFAMGTVPGILTRRYHGLLVAAPRSPVHRHVLLAKLEPTVWIDGRKFDLSCNDYPGAIHPRGHELLDSFALEVRPCWRWRVGRALIEQTLDMLPGQDTIIVRYRLLEGPPSVELDVRPLCTGRSYHALTKRGGQGEPRIAAAPCGITISWANDSPTLHLASNSVYVPSPDWFYDFCLMVETARGYDDRQDLFSPGWFRATLKRGKANGLLVAASTQPIDAASISLPPARPRAGDRPNLPYDRDPLLAPLVRAVRPFLVGGADGRATVIAGYPWFGDWGRDTFLSLPGLCLVTGRFDTARQILTSFARHVDRGMVPNRFLDSGSGAGADDAEYNTVDGSLWYVHAIGRYLDYTDDVRTVRELYPAVIEILTHYAQGTRYGIRVDADGLLAAGEPGVQLTWMDAKIGDWVVTPRIGKPVEVNALWYDALRVGEALARRFDDAARASKWNEAALHCMATFNARFWYERGGYLYDVIDCDHKPETHDASLRPNQLLAISLTHPILRHDRWEAVLRAVGSALWTPMGLRTLSRDHGDYQPHNAGDQRTRDAAYHQGTVWPWLLGPLVTAAVRAGGASATARRDARAYLSGLEKHLNEAGLGGVSEVADAEPPHTPGGCPWQAWSVAEPLRALVEDVLQLGRSPRA